MALAIRKKSPRAPSMPLNEALDRALKVYEQERLHAAPVEIIASHMGYKSANNGSAMSAIASLRYYGLFERPKDGFLAVSKNVESYKYTPSETERSNLLIEFLKAPPLFAELIEQFPGGLPSEATLIYELIQRGFLPSTAESVLNCFKQSVQFAAYFERRAAHPSALLADDPDDTDDSGPPVAPVVQVEATSAPSTKSVSQVYLQDEEVERYPVRLPGGRKAWLLIPTLFYEADKARLKAQIDLLLTEDEQ